LPSSIWIPTGLIRGEDPKFPVERFFQRKKANFVKASATAAVPC